MSWRVESQRRLAELFPTSRPAGLPPLGDAADALVRELTEASEPVTYVALAPLTNLAMALEAPAVRELIRRRLRRLVVSGGAFKTLGFAGVLNGTLTPCFRLANGTASDVAESNIFVDAVSAHKVLKALREDGVEVEFFPTDATQSLFISPEQIADGGRDLPTTMRGVLAGFADAMPPNVWPRYWDPAAVVGAVDSRFCTRWEHFSKVHLMIKNPADWKDLSFGRTEGLPTSSAEGSTVKACMNSDYDRFVELFWAPFGGLGKGVPARQATFQNWI